MKKIVLVHFLIFYCSYVYAQYIVKFDVQQPGNEKEQVYLAGSFNKWNPGDKNLQLITTPSGAFSITIRLPKGHHEYKFTRGNWAAVETSDAGIDIANREINLKSDTVLSLRIGGWLDKLRDISKLPDTIQWQLAHNRSFFYLERNLDSSYKYAQMANVMAQKLEHKRYQADMARILGRVMQRQGNYQRALEYYLKQLPLARELKDTISTAFCLLDIGHVFLGIKDYEKAKHYYRQVAAFDPNKSQAFGHSASILALVRIGKIYYNKNQLDSAKFYATKAYNLSVDKIDQKSQSEALTLLGNILADEGKTEAATAHYRLAVEQGKLYNSISVIGENYQHIARAFLKNNQTDSSFYYARKAFDLATELNNPFIIGDASNLLASLYKKSGDTDSAFKYLEMAIEAKDSLYSQDKNQQLQTILFNEELQKQEAEAEHQKFKTRIRTYAMTAGILLLLLLCIVLWLNNRRKQTINALLNQRGEKIEKTLAELEATQSQLIQKEKMASLGELTAGIAHEIQNPLNFINNFSEVNIEIAKELNEELASVPIPTAKQENFHLIIEDLIQNQLKIKEHGHRADAIVKGMLQHSRNTSGEREPINLNLLAEEFLHLSYHGLRAKNKTFNAKFKTDFDDSVPKVTVVPQNIGRVLLNLFNNAFYSVSEKKKRMNGQFDPTVWVSTKDHNSYVEICVRDNGSGIPQNIINKIFQPFYTTKPSGHGTGLGLSLSYDIITKEHGGSLSVDTEEGEWAQFVVKLPKTV
ncbi:MAG TPA: ATP-binding protein [Chitinophagaceae bacterium]|nr:ATP-binding protein [Chitinophagaceae bacterium]